MAKRNPTRRPQRAAQAKGAGNGSPAKVGLEAWWAIFDRSGWGFAIGAPDGTFVTMNPAFAEMHGYSVEELVGRPTASVLTPEWREKVPGLIRESHENGHLSIEQMHQRKDGTTFPALADVVVARDGDGRVLYRAVWVQDLTERSRAEEALLESEERFRLLAEHITEVYWLLDPEDYHVLYVSPAYEDIWGRTCQSLYEDSRSWLEGVHPEDLQRVSAALDRQRETGEFDEEFQVVRPDGSIRWVWDRGFAVKDKSGQVVRMVGIAADITERKRAEAAWRQAREELEGRVERQMLRRNPYGLTFREFTLLHLVAAGRADKEIARELDISPLTVHKHVANILSKMNAASRTEAGVRALREGLLD